MRRLPPILAFAFMVSCTFVGFGPRVSIYPAPISPKPSRPAGPAGGIDKIDHFIFIVMENRSFDHYFGTYPGADGIPKNACAPDPMLHRCVRPYHDTSLVNRGGPHGMPPAIMDVDHGKMDGFVRSLELLTHKECLFARRSPACSAYFGPQGQPDVMGYHTRHEIPTIGPTRITSCFKTTCSNRSTRGLCRHTFSSCRGGRRGVRNPTSR